MKRLAVLASVMLLLAGCASQPGPAKQLAGSLAPRAGKAYAVVSLGDGSAQPGSTYLNARYSADKAPDGMAWELGHTLQTALANDRIGSGEQAVPGRVFLLELEPGQYRFSEANRNWPDPPAASLSARPTGCRCSTALNCSRATPYIWAKSAFRPATHRNYRLLIPTSAITDTSARNGKSTISAR